VIGTAVFSVIAPPPRRLVHTFVNSAPARIRRHGSADTLAAGELIVLEAAIEHEVEALEESAVLLTLTGSNKGQ
jgi:quercetin dioxygenase-like cupin family protein